MANPRPTISSHVLDTSEGGPAAGLSISISKVAQDGIETPIHTARTDADGRIADLLGRPLETGTYRLRYELGTRSSFFAGLALDIVVVDAGRTYHVPLLLSPFGLSTYLGS
ncbi:MAG: hydroxyisourate hydrolase [Candidatus Limnocylindrales bacterium]